MVRAFESGGIVDFLHVSQSQLAPDAVLRRPDDAAIAGSELPGHVHVVELVVINLRAATVAGVPGLDAIWGPGGVAKTRLCVVGARRVGGRQAAV